MLFEFACRSNQGTYILFRQLYINLKLSYVNDDNPSSWLDELTKSKIWITDVRRHTECCTYTLIQLGICCQILIVILIEHSSLQGAAFASHRCGPSSILEEAVCVRSFVSYLPYRSVVSSGYSGFLHQKTNFNIIIIKPQ